MNALKNRSVAKLITALWCVLALFIGTFRSISAEKGEALTFFNRSSDPSVLHLSDDLAYKADLAYATDGGACLFTLGQKLEADSDLLRDMSDVAQQLRQSASPAQAAVLSQTLTQQAYTLESNIKENGLSDSDKRELDEYITNIRAVDDILARSEYNTRAREANARINAFPAGLFKSLMFVQDLEYFE